MESRLRRYGEPVDRGAQRAGAVRLHVRGEAGDLERSGQLGVPLQGRLAAGYHDHPRAAGVELEQSRGDLRGGEPLRPLRAKIRIAPAAREIADGETEE